MLMKMVKATGFLNLARYSMLRNNHQSNISGSSQIIFLVLGRYWLTMLPGVGLLNQMNTIII